MSNSDSRSSYQGKKSPRLFKCRYSTNFEPLDHVWCLRKASRFWGKKRRLRIFLYIHEVDGQTQKAESWWKLPLRGQKFAKQGPQLARRISSGLSCLKRDGIDKILQWSRVSAAVETARFVLSLTSFSAALERKKWGHFGTFWPILAHSSNVAETCENVQKTRTRHSEEKFLVEFWTSFVFCF